MGRVIFYEERNFQGRSYDCGGDCADIHVHLNRCNSCRVESGCFVAYDHPDFTGNQVFLRRGEYPDFQRAGSAPGLMGTAMLYAVRSCRMIPMHRGQFSMKVYERENYGGQMHELTDDCESLQDRYLMSNCQSSSVTAGHWLMFEQPGYRGRMAYVRPGEYRNLREAGSSMTRVSSIRRITDNC